MFRYPIGTSRNRSGNAARWRLGQGMSSMTRTITIAVAALLLASCKPTVPASTVLPASQPPDAARAPAAATAGPQAGPAARAETLDEFAARIRVECTPRGTDLDCIGGKPENGDIYDVELRPDCGPDGFFGGVASETGTELRDALPPKDESTPAVLAQGQLVCIQAIGRVGQDPSYFYVAVVPVADVPACRGNKLCSLYGGRTVTGWHGDAAACHIGAGARPSGACPQGWVRREDIEDFSNGM
jgi:hypothetical protein